MEKFKAAVNQVAASNAAVTAMGGNKSECVKVVVRCRPMSNQEKVDGREQVLFCDIKNGVFTARKPKSAKTEPGKDFTFDAVYDGTTLQSVLYEETGYAIVESVMEGYNGTIFAYGQTGTGKTHTMVGVVEEPEQTGLIPRAFQHIFKNIDTATDLKFLVRASFLEIYNEEIRDLLSKNPKVKLELKDHPDSGVYVKDLTAFVVKGVSELNSVMAAGQKNRSVASTLMNNESSRSHSIFTITIETADMGNAEKEGHIRAGKMNMVDLAGSERQSKTGATGDTLKEATKINMSLSALGNVISALVDSKSSFVPYRDSKLTRLLQDSLGGNTKTVMIACVGPADYNYDESISTLRYAYRAKSIKNKPRINEDPKDAMIREFQEEIAKLKAQLAASAGGGAPGETRFQTQTEVVEVEKEVVVERVVEKVMDSGFTKADMEEMERKVAQEKAELRMQMNIERQAIEEQRNIAEEEKQRLLDDLAERRRKKEQETEAQNATLQKLKAMEDKMLVGTQVMQKAMQQEEELKKAKIEQENRKRAEQRAKDELEQQVGDKLILEEKYENAQEQVEKLTIKLEKLWQRYQSATQEVSDLQREMQTKRDEMLEDIREITKEVKYYSLMIDSHIPVDIYQKIEARALWDDQQDEWVMAKIHLAGSNINPQDAHDGSSPNGTGFRRHNGDPGTPGDGRMGMDRSVGSNLEEGEGQGADIMSDEQPNVYFVYTEDGGAVRAESSNKNKDKNRGSSARRPCTASRKGRGIKKKEKEKDKENTKDQLFGNLPQNPFTEDETKTEGAGRFPVARGLVRD